MRNDHAGKIAMCGLMAALAIVIMCLGGLIPVATYVCPVICTLIGNLVFKLCGRRFAWTWYGAVCLLSVLFAPDKEAAVVYAFLGFYPCIKPYFDKGRIGVLFKLVYFNGVALTAYGLALWVLGLTEILQEYAQMGFAGMVIVLILANITFFILDKLLGRRIINSD